MCENSIQTNFKSYTETNCLPKYNPEKPLEDNYQEVKWQIDDNFVVPQDDLYILAWEAEIGGHLFDFPIKYTDPNAIVLTKVTCRDQLLLLSRAPISMIQVRVKTGKPFVLKSSNPKLHGQSQDIETATDLGNNDSSKQMSDSSTNTGTEYEPLQKPSPQQSGNLLMLEINDPTTENIPKNEPSQSRGGKYNLRPNPNPNY